MQPKNSHRNDHIQEGGEHLYGGGVSDQTNAITMQDQHLASQGTRQSRRSQQRKPRQTLAKKSSAVLQENTISEREDAKSPSPELVSIDGNEGPPNLQNDGYMF